MAIFSRKLHKKIFKKIETDKGLIEFGIKEDEKGKVKLAVFEIIDMKDTSDLVHQNRDLIRLVKDFLKTDKKDFLTYCTYKKY